MRERRTVLVDGRTFSLQRKGGVSQLWAKILQTDQWRRNLKTALFVYPGHTNNMHLQDLVRHVSPEDVTIIESETPPSDSLPFTEEGAAKRRHVVLQKHLKNPVHAVFNTYYGENIWPECSQYIVVAHDFAHEEVPELQRKETTPGVLRRKQQAFEEASVIIVISDSSRAKLQHYYGGRTSAPLRVVHHGHDAYVPDVRKVPGLVVHVGNRSGYKNFRILMSVIQEIMKQYSYVSFIIMGGEQEETELSGAVQEFPRRVVWVPDPSDSEIDLAMALADVYASASRYEGFGIPLLNALRLGTKAAVSAIPPYKEIAGSNAFYFDPLAKKSVLETVTAALESKQRPSGYWRTWEEVASDYVETVR